MRARAETLHALAAGLAAWTPPPLPGAGEVGAVRLCEGHAQNAALLFPQLVPLAAREAAERGRVVLGLFGGSGSGKSGTACLLAHYFRAAGVGCLVVAGDEYPHRVPVENDRERLRIFHAAGLRGMVEAGVYTLETAAALQGLQQAGTEASPAQQRCFPWLRPYQEAGRAALEAYLGCPAEQSFEELNGALDAFRRGESRLWLRHLGQSQAELRYEAVEVEDASVLLLEWTHAASPHLRGVDISILLGGAGEETRARRRERGRDANTDSAFTTMVLELEQRSIDARAHAAQLILSVDGRLQSPAEYLAEQEGKHP